MRDPKPTSSTTSARNRRRAYDGNGREIAPLTVGSMLAEYGIGHVVVVCRALGCGQSGRVSIEGWTLETAIPDIDLRLRCSRCGARGNATVAPDWAERSAVLSPEEKAARNAKVCLSPSARSQAGWWR